MTRLAKDDKSCTGEYFTRNKTMPTPSVIIPVKRHSAAATTNGAFDRRCESACSKQQKSVFPLPCSFKITLKHQEIVSLTTREDCIISTEPEPPHWHHQSQPTPERSVKRFNVSEVVSLIPMFFNNVTADIVAISAVNIRIRVLPVH